MHVEMAGEWSLTRRDHQIARHAPGLWRIVGNFEYSNAAAGVSGLAIVRLSGFVASYAKSLLASAPGVWAAADVQIASTLENITEAARIHLSPILLIQLNRFCS